MDNKEQEVWLFRFALERDDGKPFDHNKPNELMDVIITWAEQNGLQVGGGFRAPDKGEFDKPYEYR